MSGTASARFIETVPRAGYRFIASVTRSSPAREAMSLRWPVGVPPANPAVSEGHRVLSIGHCPRSDVRRRACRTRTGALRLGRTASRAACNGLRSAHAECAGAPVSILAALEAAYAAGGRRAVLRYSLDRMSPRGPALGLAIVHGDLGHLDEAFAHLNRAIDGRDPCLVDLAVGPQWDSLRTDPRFDHCLARLGLSHVRRRERPADGGQ